MFQRQKNQPPAQEFVEEDEFGNDPYAAYRMPAAADFEDDEETLYAAQEVPQQDGGDELVKKLNMAWELATPPLGWIHLAGRLLLTFIGLAGTTGISTGQSAKNIGETLKKH